VDVVSTAGLFVVVIILKSIVAPTSPMHFAISPFSTCMLHRVASVLANLTSVQWSSGGWFEAPSCCIWVLPRHD
jgi:hypothetical protein